MKTIAVDFDALSRPFVGKSCYSLHASALELVLDANPEFGHTLCGVLNDVYGADSWSSPGNSQFRQLFYWVLRGIDPSVRQRMPDGERVEVLLADLREKAVRADEDKAYMRHIYEDVREAMERWVSAGFGVVTFSHRLDAERQREILHLNDVPLPQRCFRFRGPAIVRGVLTSLTLEPHCILFISPTHERWATARANGCPQVALFRRMAKPYREPGYGLTVGTLLDIDPAEEFALADKSKHWGS